MLLRTRIRVRGGESSIGRAARFTRSTPPDSAKTMIVRGERIAPDAEHVKMLVDGMAGSVAIEIANAGHSPMVDSAAEFDPRLREFLFSA